MNEPPLGSEFPTDLTPAMIDIDSMPAGKEMDSLVAEKVMGLPCSCFLDPAYCAVHGLSIPTDSLRRYSTSIAAAFGVVEKLKEYHWDMEWNPITKLWEVEPWPHVGWHENEFFVQADTLPLAICRAALKAVMK